MGCKVLLYVCSTVPVPEGAFLGISNHEISHPTVEKVIEAIIIKIIHFLVCFQLIFGMII